jgi:predicted methyltransferase
VVEPTAVSRATSEHCQLLPQDQILDHEIATSDQLRSERPEDRDQELEHCRRCLHPGFRAGQRFQLIAGFGEEQPGRTAYVLALAWVIEKVEAAGFKLVARSEINANPNDNRDHPKAYGRYRRNTR